MIRLTLTTQALPDQRCVCLCLFRDSRFHQVSWKLVEFICGKFMVDEDGEVIAWSELPGAAGLLVESDVEHPQLIEGCQEKLALGERTMAIGAFISLKRDVDRMHHPFINSIIETLLKPVEAVKK